MTKSTSANYRRLRAVSAATTNTVAPSRRMLSPATSRRRTAVGRSKLSMKNTNNLRSATKATIGSSVLSQDTRTANQVVSRTRAPPCANMSGMRAVGMIDKSTITGTLKSIKSPPHAITTPKRHLAPTTISHLYREETPDLIVSITKCLSTTLARSWCSLYRGASNSTMSRNKLRTSAMSVSSQCNMWCLASRGKSLYRHR